MEAPDHILIVDDDPGIRELVTQYLRKQGLQASAAADGRQMRAVLACRPCLRRYCVTSSRIPG
ncbi:MAG: response regulator, partial [Comamonadaceae bacterium]